MIISISCDLIVFLDNFQVNVPVSIKWLVYLGRKAQAYLSLQDDEHLVGDSSKFADFFIRFIHSVLEHLVHPHTVLLAKHVATPRTTLDLFVACLLLVGEHFDMLRHEVMNLRVLLLCPVAEWLDEDLRDGLM